MESQSLADMVVAALCSGRTCVFLVEDGDKVSVHYLPTRAPSVFDASQLSLSAAAFARLQPALPAARTNTRPYHAPHHEQLDYLIYQGKVSLAQVRSYVGRIRQHTSPRTWRVC